MLIIVLSAFSQRHTTVCPCDREKHWTPFNSLLWANVLGFLHQTANSEEVAVDSRQIPPCPTEPKWGEIIICNRAEMRRQRKSGLNHNLLCSAMPEEEEAPCSSREVWCWLTDGEFRAQVKKCAWEMFMVLTFFCVHIIIWFYNDIRITEYKWDLLKGIIFF